MKDRRTIGFWLIVTTASTGGTVRADEGEPPRERESGPEHCKLATTEATPIEAHAVALEASYAPNWDLHGVGSFERSDGGYTHTFGFAITYGIANDFDATVSFGYATAYAAGFGGSASGSIRGHGLTDTTVHTRWRFLGGRDLGLDVAIRSGFVIPTGASVSADSLWLSQGYWSFDNALLASKDFGAFTVDVEVGYSLPFGAQRQEQRGTLFGNLAGGWEVFTWLQPEVELNYEHSYTAGGTEGSDVLAVTGGFVVPFGEDRLISVGMQCATWGRHAGQTAGGIAILKWTL